MSTRDFYDEYVTRQLRVGVNDRHRAIVGALRRFGWQPQHRVLEIGSGVGTLTELIAEGMGESGELVGVDLSPKSIAAALERLSRFAAVRLLAGDILELELDGAFDVIVLPDVIEHIPLEHHPELFRRVASWLRPAGFVLLNYPNPPYLAWCHEHRPDLVQVIDQPIQADILLANACPSGLYLYHLETYSLWVKEGDYVMAVLRPAASADTFTEVVRRPSLAARLRHRIARLT
jgi:2-polyprenyl-3-methyl-5-hydroxy-6-metoxy-1,4-benzoquinol methylase